MLKNNNSKVRSYSFYGSLYKKINLVKPIKYKSFSKEYDSHSLRELSPQTGILIMIDGTSHNWFQNGRKTSLHLVIDDTNTSN